MKRRLRILHVTNMWPSSTKPYLGAFVRAQIDSLSNLNLDQKVVFDNSYCAIRAKTKIEIDTFNPDLVHAHFGYTAAFIVDICKLKNIPLIISYCGGDINGERGSIFRKIKSNVGVIISKLAGIFSKRIIVKTTKMFEKLPVSLKHKSMILPNGINLTKFMPIAKETARLNVDWDADLVVLFGGRAIDPTKNYALAKLAVDIIQNQGIKIELKTVSNIKHDDMPNIINAADVILLTSLEEGSPNTIKEALACEVPIVSVPVGDVPWLLAGVTNTEIVPYDAEEIAKAILKLLSNGTCRTNGREMLASKGLDDVNVASKIVEIYAQTTL